MIRAKVKSSNIVSVGYDSEKKILEIEFAGQGIYQYADVPSLTVAEFMRAESKGKYFYIKIKPNYDATKIKAPIK